MTKNESHSAPLYHFQIQVTTYNAPEDIQRLLESVRIELATFSFPAERISLIIVDDSDDERSLEANRAACQSWPFRVQYYGPLEQKAVLRESSHSAAELATLVSLFDKQMDDFEAHDHVRWGHKGVAGAMNMALYLARRTLRPHTWTISVDEDVTLDTYMRMPTETYAQYERRHVMSYFHRLCCILDEAKKHGGVDLLLGASVGDYCTPKLTWKVVRNFIACAQELKRGILRQYSRM